MSPFLFECIKDCDVSRFIVIARTSREMEINGKSNYWYLITRYDEDTQAGINVYESVKSEIHLGLTNNLAYWVFGEYLEFLVV
jgi:hypothetical protein